MQTWLSYDLCPVFRTCVRSTDGQQTCTLGVVGPLSLTFLAHDSQPMACAKRSFALVCLLPLCCTCVPAILLHLGAHTPACRRRLELDGWGSLVGAPAGGGPASGLVPKHSLA